MLPLRDLNTVPWPEPANCVGLDPNIFFPVDNTHNNTAEAERACRPCPAKKWCATQAITNKERYGVWAESPQVLCRILVS